MLSEHPVLQLLDPQFFDSEGVGCHSLLSIYPHISFIPSPHLSPSLLCCAVLIAPPSVSGSLPELMWTPLPPPATPLPGKSRIESISIRARSSPLSKTAFQSAVRQRRRAVACDAGRIPCLWQEKEQEHTIAMRAGLEREAGSGRGGAWGE